MPSRFEQINVFATHSLKGNPLAVVHCQDEDYSTDTMQHFARWTQLSETVFITPSPDPNIDYRVRIFTPHEELPFAGHPTLGACHSWLNGRRQAVIYQQSAIGVVEIRQIDDQLFFQAPPLIEHRPFSEGELQQVLTATGLAPEDIVINAVLRNGPLWHCLVVNSEEKLQAIAPTYSAIADLNIGLCHVSGATTDLLVRAFLGSTASEDPVTGSLQAVLAQWLIAEGKIPTAYRAQQGSAVGAAGEIEIQCLADKIFIGGYSTTVIRGEVTLPTD